MDTSPAAPQTQPEQRKRLFDRFPLLRVKGSGDFEWCVFVNYEGDLAALMCGPINERFTPEGARNLARALYAAADAIDAERTETALGFTP